jgi:2,4-dienoyl-CoA reductase-like NADH-dependent reductase (Old Yellow Enzyme family)
MTHPAFTPYRLGSLELPNRIIKTATYEGMVVDGLPSEVLARHHAELARGGVGMTTVAYCSVSDEGRTFKNQMVMKDESLEPLRALTRAVHDEGAKVMIQLGHCGGFSKNEELGLRGPHGPSFGFNAYGALKGMVFAREMSKQDIARVTDDFRRAAVTSFEAGFDAVELHVGHGYLLSQFVSPLRNKRRDEYGGSLENRLRFPLEVIRAVREELGADAPVFAKMNLDDGVKRGLHIDDAVLCAQAFERAGISALVLSGGLVSHSALYLLRGERPLRAMIEVEENPLQKVALAMFGPVFVPKTPFEPLFFLPMARKVREAVSCPLVYLGGATSLDELSQVREEGFEMIAMGRALIHDPMLLAKYQRGEATTSGCTPCNLCITEMDRPGGVLCANQPWQLERRTSEVGAGKHLRVCSKSGASS